MRGVCLLGVCPDCCCSLSSWDEGQTGIKTGLALCVAFVWDGGVSLV